jgi:membrane protease YdiL (CAAX protease family)
MTPEILLQLFDYIMLAFVALGVPFIGHLIHTHSVKEEASGNSKARKNSYYHTFALLWIPTIVLLWFWTGTDRSLDLLGLGFNEDIWGSRALIISLVISLIYFAQYFLIVANKKSRESIKNQLKNSPGIEEALPKNKKEYDLFKLLSITAGITEEILFRGFLIWGFSAFMNIWLASTMALISFTLAHLYQKSLTNLLKVAGTGAVMTGLYISSGSLIPSIIAHIVIDLAANAIVWEANKKEIKA